jgi:hypothetical protein
MVNGRAKGKRAKALFKPRGREVPAKIRLFLFVRAAGRCEFDGCNRWSTTSPRWTASSLRWRTSGRSASEVREVGRRPSKDCSLSVEPSERKSLTSPK